MWTNIPGFDRLSAEEITALTEAPVLVTLLVGAADGKFDREERTWSARLVESRTYSKPKILNEFYRVVSQGFLTKADALSKVLPADAASRNRDIEQKLTSLNAILPKLEPHLRYALYKSLLTLAEETAKASGGFLRIGAVSGDEYAWVKLPMIRPIERPMDFETNQQDEEEEGAED